MSAHSTRLAAVIVVPLFTVAGACDGDRVAGPDPFQEGPAAAKQGTTSGRMLFGRDGQVWVMNADGTNQVQLTHVGLNDQPSWAPGGKRVLFAAVVGGAPGIYSMNSDGTGLTRITIPPAGATDLIPVALGKRVAFLRDLAGTRKIYAVNLDGTQLTQLTEGPRDAEFDASPKGDRLAYASETGQGGLDIYVLDVAGRGVTQLTHSPTLYKAGIAFSPSGKQIAFTMTDPGVPEAIFVMRADGTEVTRVSQGGHYDFLPRWSPDGKRIGFTSFRGTGGLFTMLADGSDVATISPVPDFLWAWAP